MYKEEGGQPSAALQRAVLRARRACARGAGPPRHTAAMLVKELRALQDTPDPWSNGGPLHPRRTLVLGCWWLTREIELSNTLIEDIEWAPDKATWNLSASKSDPRALGAARSHQCACGSAPNAPDLVPRTMCPVCCMRDQISFATRLAKGNTQAPLFPDTAKGCPSKTSMVETIKAAAAKMGCDLFTASGAAAWGGHALRRGGAQYLAASGIDVWRIQALARHSSSAILTYLDGIHAKHLGNIAAEAELGRSLQGLREELRLLQAGVSSEHAKVRVSALIAPPAGTIAIAADLGEVLPPAPDATVTLPTGQ